MTNFTGEFAALSAAFFWALASFIYSKAGVNISPLILNFFKGIIAIFFLSITLIIRQEPLDNVNVLTLQLLLLSGIIGIGVGDTAFFFALHHLGARRALLMETLAPPLTAIFGLIFLQESLNIRACSGILITILGVVWVITERTEASVINSRHLKSGFFWALLTEISQATGIILSRSALVNSPISPLWSTLLRLLAGLFIIIILLFMFRQKHNKILDILPSKKLVFNIFIASILGTYLGMTLQQTSLKYTSAGIAQTLSSTSPLFILPIVLVMGEKVSLRAIGGVVLSIVGIGILFNA